ncbi:unnamed protein product [Ambrosiozyma monospora]|uniref:Unnamed protein product n=1 Tax=Ambrosiozyma monospora TaxID=43982 RepID=A0ACB5UBL0_AMBMO|nr:unnamed protein product [Ambrosiozyma monospora]
MSLRNAVNIANYVIPYCFRKKHPLLSTPRSDIKSILDKVYEVIGDVNQDDPVISKNSSALTEYLETKMLDVRHIKFAFYGLIELKLDPCDVPGISAIQSGLYFMLGLIAVQIFKIRKRAMQGRSVELDFVIKMFKADLVCGSNRLETWLLLAV